MMCTRSVTGLGAAWALCRAAGSGHAGLRVAAGGYALARVNDLVHDGNVAYTVVIGAASSTDTLYNGLNPADIALTNIDDDPAVTSKFYVVNDGSPDRTYEYNASGAAVENYAINSGNTAPRGIADKSAWARFRRRDCRRRHRRSDGRAGAGRRRLCTHVV